LVLLGLLGLDGGPDGDVADLDVVGLLDGEGSPRCTARRSTSSSRPHRPCSSNIGRIGRWLWFERVAAYARIKRDVFAAVEVGVWRNLSAHSLGPIGDALTLLLDAGKADGTFRPDVDARDVILLIGYLSRLDDAESDARALHLLGIIMDGLRRRA
jgi:hypothetical protein